MNMPAVHVIKPGLLTTVQDQGRWGFQALGVSVAGPMDPVSQRIANAMAGNPAEAATLEITLVGPELVFEDERRVAISGAQYEMTVGQQQFLSGGAFVVGSGATLRFGRRVRGARAYLAVAGGFDTTPVLRSRATHLPSMMGGLAGRALIAGDRLPCGHAPRRPAPTVFVPPGTIGDAIPDGGATVRVLPGPQADRFRDDALEVLQSAPYRVDPSSNRMGFSLNGPPLSHTRGADIISDATPLGVLQVPASGQPILLMADRQTSGGYPKVATVITADIALAGQLGPGDTIAFAVCSRGEALAALIGQEQRLMAMEAALR
jgi:antagonist of KipI